MSTEIELKSSNQIKHENEYESGEEEVLVDENVDVTESESEELDDHDDNHDLESSKQDLYQNAELAAAQMMHLMSSSSSSSSNGIENHYVQSTGLENEKENIPICKYCNKIFANFSNLNHHISAIHLNQSKWVCSQCSKVCSSKSNLKVHLRVHLRVKPYHCRWCSYSCMHHSSIRDHLAKVHPDRTHTPLQPGYIFNSHAVPEPDVFNSKNFNLTNFVNDSKIKRSNDEPITPEKSKRSRVTNNKKDSSNNQNQQIPQQQIQQQNMVNNGNQMSNIYNAYTMARMLPFMYPMHLQYAAAAAAAAGGNQQTQQQHQQQQAGLFGLNNIMQFNSRTNVPNTPYQPMNGNYSMMNHLSYNTNVNNASSSFEDHTSSNLSYSNSNSTSSRSASLSPADKATSEMVNLVAKQIKSIATSIEQEKYVTSQTQSDEHDIKDESPVKVKNENQNDNLPQTPFLPKTLQTSSPTMASSPKNTLTVDQILSNKSNKSTQTEPSCLKCPYCNNKTIS